MAMRRLITYPLAAIAAAGATLAATGSAASAHGYVSSPPSRQALCAARAVPDCGPIQFEPQSVEGPKGQRNCNGGLSQFAVLNDNSRNWPAKAVGKTVSFSWALTARHRTSTWEYFIGDKRVAVFDDGNKQPEAVVTHQVDLSAFPGRQTVLAVWNIGDTPMAFYNCIDLNVGGGGGSAPEPTGQPTTPPATPSQPSQPDTTPSQPGTPSQSGSPSEPGSPSAPGNTSQPGSTSQPGGAAGTWAAGTSYRTGDQVTFNGKSYQCRQGHTALRGWEPSQFTLALWLPL
ncbi:lytic polysaccharide monooxygenase [Krasilnikovia sp. M28-CT-15]|uniref:lytic polysaccharide monooxygenase n=1 Tax=Krasilnikovia sp. M28-CT-15 TaxID=3373540 RepID=UPI0038761102